MSTHIAEIRNNTFPELTVALGDYVVWRNTDSVPHTVETDPKSSYYFNVGPLPPNETSSPVRFSKPGRFDYVCRFHHDMEGAVAVRDVNGQPPHDHGDHGGGHGGHGGHNVKHFHGFVTGGRSGDRLYMSHTPVIADERHHFQIILRCSFEDSAHKDIYDQLRATAFGAGKVQTFHDHLALEDIGSGAIKRLPECNLIYHPPEAPNGTDIVGLETKVPVRIDKVLHFHQFAPDAEYPDGLTYIMYGDADDIFIDHHIIGAPSFHSVAKLKKRPAFWTDERIGGTIGFKIPEKRMIDASPKVHKRVAFVDNAYHLSWLPPSGAFGTLPDPLKRRDNSAPNYDVLLEDGAAGAIEIESFIHFDVGLLNNRVVIT